jgi:hypothetical protein
LACQHGNSLCLKWLFEKFEAHKIPIDLEKEDDFGMSPLVLLCHRGSIDAKNGQGIKKATDGGE